MKIEKMVRKGPLIAFRCPECEKKLGLKVWNTPGKMPCPGCGLPLVVPQPPPENPADAAPPEEPSGGLGPPPGSERLPDVPGQVEDDPLAALVGQVAGEPEPQTAEPVVDSADPLAALAAMANGDDAEADAPPSEASSTEESETPAIKFACPACEQMLGVKARMAGHHMNCPGCHERIQVPGGDTRRKTEPTDKMVMRCHHCSKRLAVRPDWVGQKLKCPACGDYTQVPEKPSGLARRRSGKEDDRIEAQCEACGAKVRAKEEYAGRRVGCPECKEPIQLPEA